MPGRIAVRRRRTVYRINVKRFAVVVVLLAAVIMLAILLHLKQSFQLTGYSPHDFHPDQLLMYFSIGSREGVPWHYLAAVDKAEEIPGEELSSGRSSEVALALAGIRGDGQLPDFLKLYRDDGDFIERVLGEVKKFTGLLRVYEDKGFPIDPSCNYYYQDSYGDGRSYGGARRHEGIDIMCNMGVPVYSVGDGVIEQAGWNEYGGWRIGIRGTDGVYYYYAHLSKYQGRPDKGDRVKKGQLIGYAGDSGYGPEGTTGQFAPHLHFGMYTGPGSKLKAFNPYPFLKTWEGLD